MKSLKLYVEGGFKLEDTRIKNYWSQLSAWGALDHLPGFKLQFVLPEDLVRDGNLNEGRVVLFLKNKSKYLGNNVHVLIINFFFAKVKRLLQPVAEVSSVSFYKRKRQL